jgi:hypothetical protein
MMGERVQSLWILGALILPCFWGAGDVRADDWGTIKGRIVWAGDIPAPKPIEGVKSHQDKKACEAKGEVVSEELVINKENKGLRWVFVWLIPEEGKKLPIHPSLEEIKEKEVVVDQPCCQFEPRGVGLRQGQTLVVKNSAPVAHNVNWTGGVKNPGNNLIIPAKGDPIKVANLVADRFPIRLACNIHGWMTGWVRVFDHPYFAITDAEGKFEIKNAPAGKHRLMIWHETGYLGGVAGAKGQPIEIKKDSPTDLGKIDWKN